MLKMIPEKTNCVPKENILYKYQIFVIIGLMTFVLYYLQNIIMNRFDNNLLTEMILNIDIF